MTSDPGGEQVQQSGASGRRDDWQTLGVPAPPRLVDARLQLHWAAQVVGAVGHTHLEPRPDDSHTNLRWFAPSGGPAGGALAGGALTGRRPCRAALRCADPALLLFGGDGGDRPLEVWRLDGRTLDEAYAWMAAAIATHGGGEHRGPLRRRDYAPPPHPVGAGRAFATGDSAAFAELGRWFASAARALDELTAGLAGASPVRCWPHHFDIASLVTVRAHADPEQARSIGAGLSPGDASYAEPYWYVNPWPPPSSPPPPPPPSPPSPPDLAASLPELEGGGAWHTEGWFGAVLSGSVLVAAAPDRRRARLAAFHRSALQACRMLLEAE